ncbi:MAG TPA: multiheme c-type cytochrome, partial [Rhodoblastus sp.]|nr:multiheme c-type cytochrome [Rhodoblastus sp.]
MRPFVLSLILLVLALVPVRADETAAFVGSQSCAACHPAQFKDWKTSHHAGAMQVADDKTVLGDFNDAHLRKGEVESRFFRRDGKFFVRTDGPDGQLADFEIKYTFGLYPLQQYLIELPGGRLQAFGIAWDARPKEQGGQKWFDLYPDRKLAAGDPLHWTGIDQNWNYQCAWCHSTDLKKNYDPAKNTYATHWSEISVGCEACHGPASRHLAWTKGGAGLSADEKANKGLALRFDQRRGVNWTPNPQGTAARSTPPGA